MAKLYFTYSAMNAGKSTMLLQSAYNYRERGMEVMLWTSSLYKGEDDELAQISAVDELHQEVVVTGGLSGVMDCDDVRM